MASQTEAEFAEFNAHGNWNEVFQRLKNEASLLTLGEDYSTKLAREPDNRRKNRYRDVSPYDHSRVKLAGESDYINASLIEVPEANRRYILTQGPLEHTMGDFWQMTWEQETKAVVMLNRVVEKGTLKCSQYWPLGADYGYEEDMYFPECGLRVTLCGEQDFQHFTLRTLELEHMETGSKREILHFHYTTWPDFGVPSSPNAFLHFLHVIRQTGSLESDVGPAIVHCSAGIGRSGTFCLVDSCLIMVQDKGTLKCINVREALIRMRSFRMGLIQTPDQLRFSYLAIIEGAHAILNSGGLDNISVSPSVDQRDHMEGLPPPPPHRTTSLQPPKPERQNFLDLLGEVDEEPPPIPPKKNPIMRQTGMSEWGEREDDETENLIPGDEEEEEEEFDTLIDRDEGGSSDENEEEEAEIRAANMRHRIREERKKETMEKIREMKEKQRRSERWRPYKSFFSPAVYLGLAILVGVTGIVVYKYFL